MIFTFGASCRNAAKLRNKLNAQIGNLQAEAAAAQKLDKRFGYFDSLKKLAATLTQEATGLLDITKEFRSKLQGTQKELEQDFTEEEIDDQLGDVDFMNDFAEQLFDALDRLRQQCDIVINDCKARKKRLTDALIWNKIGEEDEELMELAASNEATQMAHFYDDLAAGCTKFFSDASKKFASDASDYEQIIQHVHRSKYMIMNYARDEFHVVKGKLFNIVDSMIDSQNAIESVEEYFKGRIKYMDRRITSDMWKYQLKYSTGVTKRCASESTRIEEFDNTINESNKVIAKRMHDAYAAFVKGAKADLNAWDCDVMYPRPREVDIGKPKWLGSLTKQAKQAFDIYNVVKNFIPGGSKAGAGKVPGSTEEEYEELFEMMKMPGNMKMPDVDWDTAKETAKGLGNKLLKDMEADEAEGNANMAARLQIWKQAVAMCNADKDSFKDEITVTANTIKLMAKPV